MSLRRLEGKVCIVTGSSAGLGRAIALAYAREGGLIVCADLKPEARQEVQDELDTNTHVLIEQEGGRATFLKTDVSKAEAMEALVEHAVSTFGRIDVLVNNAGISIEAGLAAARIHETLESTWDTTMAVNVKSVFLSCKYVVRQMLQQKEHASGERGWIINMSSIFGLIGGRHNSSYAASKGAVSNLTRTIALDYAKDRIHCNAICPGYTKTAIFANTVKTLHSIETLEEKHPLGGVGTPGDITGAAIFLASDEARWITGVCLPVDGGYTAQ